MKGLLSVVCAALVGVTVVAAPPAQADQWSYVSRLSDQGVYYESVLAVIATGRQTCHYLRQGYPVGDVMRGIGSLGYSVTEEALITIAAAYELCPDQLVRVRAYGDGQGA